jgi:hypothetical protein
MRRFSSFVVLLASLGIAGCANPSSSLSARDVDCSSLRTPDQQGTWIKVTLMSGESLDVVGIEPDWMAPDSIRRMRVSYEGCSIILIRDAEKVELTGEGTHQITLNNGKHLIVKGPYDRRSKRRFNAYQVTYHLAYVASSDESAYMTNPEEIAVRSVRFLEDVKTISVFKTPLTAVQVSAINAHQEALARRNEERLREEDERRARDREKRLEWEAERQRRADEAAQEAQRAREYARDTVARPENIGSRICKNGSLSYQTLSTYFLRHGQSQYVARTEPGQLVAFLEGISPDRYRIQFRVAAWATETGSLSAGAAGPVSFEMFAVVPGTVYWDEVTGWFNCN